LLYALHNLIGKDITQDYSAKEIIVWFNNSKNTEITLAKALNASEWEWKRRKVLFKIEMFIYINLSTTTQIEYLYSSLTLTMMSYIDKYAAKLYHVKVFISGKFC